MKWKDIRPGVVVYHSMYTHWGKGIVQKETTLPWIVRMFEKGNPRRIAVQWSHHETTEFMRLRELRKTPNRKKIKAMVEVYRRRNLVAVDGGDRLILPAK